MTADSTDPYNPKIAVLIGDSRGIGYHISSTLVDRGIKIVIGSRNEKQGQKVAKEFNERLGNEVSVFLRTDVTKYDDLKALFALAESKFGGVDIAIMNAGIVGDKNTCGAFLPLDGNQGVSAAKKNIIALQDKGGVIINTSSMAGIPHYNAFKSAVKSWTEALNADLYIALNIRVNAICPWYVDTDILNDLPDNASSRVSTFLHIIENTKINGETPSVWSEPSGFRIEGTYASNASR
ncbi:hypothetical protein BDC45DRAFT_609794 [Circinella umbellata]|nr:hypothetical protein BDC45DRAFT_609794 [Circinella umbellata]